MIITTRGVARIPFLEAMVGHKILDRRSSASGCLAVAAWGRKPSAREAEKLARRHNLPCWRLEDGFLRSFGTGDHFPPLSVVVDDTGIFYDSTCASALENLLNSAKDVLAGIGGEVARAKAQILAHGLSKYNHAAALPAGLLRENDGQRVLVIDQTAGDLSITLGGADSDSFATMLAAARAENPGATIYVKTHPEVVSGRKGGYLAHIQDDERTVVLRSAINPLSLITNMDRIYVVTSTMGFEALLAGKPVSCFGLPWYAGWGSTDDRQPCPRRNRTRSVDELFAAAYFHYSRYLDPVTRQRGSIFSAIAWLMKQKEEGARLSPAAGRMIGVGYRRWKAANVKPLLSLHPGKVVFVPDSAEARRLQPDAADCLVFWGRTPPAGLEELAAECGARLLHMEDGFVRSVGLGSDFIRPLSLVLDQRGLYFDPTRPSDLEQLLNTAAFSDEEIRRARQVRAFIVEHGITKYNMEPRETVSWASTGRPVVLVPGQVEDDASIRFGCTEVATNLDLLKAARRARPDAYLVYKPHPDVMSGNRKGRLALAQAREFADHVETRLSVVSCIEACSEVHTMTSLTGFDALLRGKKVVTYGQPFYAGWGLTEDRVVDGVAFARRQRRLALDELVAGALLRYPIYWDWELKGYTTCEAVLQRIVETRNALEADGGLEKLRLGYFRRQWRKVHALVNGWLDHVRSASLEPRH